MGPPPGRLSTLYARPRRPQNGGERCRRTRAPRRPWRRTVKTVRTAAFLSSAALALTLTNPVAANGGAPPMSSGQPTAVRTLDRAASTSRPDVVVARDGTVTVVWSRERQVVARSR